MWTFRSNREIEHFTGSGWESVAQSEFGEPRRVWSIGSGSFLSAAGNTIERLNP
ncbi:MAG: hypothetical protein AB7K71_12635 [Polyangiaceae bacterium]